MSFRRPVTVFLVALALCAGPAAAACVDCCPKSDSGQAATLSIPACCGNCATSLDRSPDPGRVVVKSTLPQPAFVAVVPLSATITFSASHSRGGVSFLPTPRSGPTNSPVPLRL